MIYDKLPVALLSALSTEREGTTNAIIARYLVTHSHELHDVTIKGVASACNVGMGSVSRFCRDVGFRDFDELRSALGRTSKLFTVASCEDNLSDRMEEHASYIGQSLQHVASTLDVRMLHSLVEDLHKYQTVFVCGMLKAQAAAIDLQVDLLMMGKYVETCVGYAEQLRRIAAAREDDLVLVFSYTGSYFESSDLKNVLSRIDRPRIWLIAGTKKPQPEYVYSCLSFESDLEQLTHPFQLEMAAAIISQEYARAQK